MKIVILDGFAVNPGDMTWDGIASLGELTVYERTAKNKVMERISGAEIVFTNKTAITREIMESCPDLKYIGIFATGYNVVDIQAATDLGIIVTNVPAYSTAAVTQHMFALMLELFNHVGLHAQAVREGMWAQSSEFCFWLEPLTEIAEKTLTIIGFGSIGQSVARVALAFGMKVLAVARRPENAPVLKGVELVSLDEGLSRGDVITIHCPLTEQTRGLIDKDAIAKMKDGAVVINTARGPITVDADIRAALDSGKLSGYAADVASNEPMRPDNPLIDAPNCIITPHIAWAPLETRERLMSIAVSNLQSFLDGTPVNVVNNTL